MRSITIYLDEDQDLQKSTCEVVIITNKKNRHYLSYPCRKYITVPLNMSQMYFALTSYQCQFS